MGRRSTVMSLHSFCHQHKGGNSTGTISAEQAVHEAHHPTVFCSTEVSNIPNNIVVWGVMEFVKNTACFMLQESKFFSTIIFSPAISFLESLSI